MRKQSPVVGAFKDDDLREAPGVRFVLRLQAGAAQQFDCRIAHKFIKADKAYQLGIRLLGR